MLLERRKRVSLVIVASAGEWDPLNGYPTFALHRALNMYSHNSRNRHELVQGAVSEPTNAFLMHTLRAIGREMESSKCADDMVLVCCGTHFAVPSFAWLLANASRAKADL
eukprot:2728243-Amphidinium_carterae.1